MKKILLVIAFTIRAAIVVVAQDTSISLSIEKAKELALLQNIDLLNSSLDVQKAAQQLAEIKSKKLPQVEGYSNFSYYYGIPKMILPGELIGQSGLIPVEIGTKFDWSSGFKATQLIFNKSYTTSLRIAEKMIEMAKLSKDKKQKDLQDQVAKVYYLAVSTGMQISLLNKSVANIDKVIDITKLLNVQGLVRKIDVSKININKNNILTQIDNLKQLQEQQKNLLGFLLGLKNNTYIEIADTTFSYSAEYLLQQPDFNNKPDILLINQQKEITALSKKSIQQSYYPTLSGFWQHYYQSQRNKLDFFDNVKQNFFRVGLVGLSLDVPIFDGFEKRSKIKQKDIEYQQANNNIALALQNYNRQYNDALTQLKTQIAALTRFEENVRIAREAYEIDLLSYKQGILSQNDLLITANNLIEAELNRVNQQYQIKNAELELQQIILNN